MPIRAARTVAGGFLRGAAASILPWGGAGILAAVLAGGAAWLAARTLAPMATYPVTVMAAMVGVLLWIPVAFTGTMRAGVRRAVRDSGLSRIVADGVAEYVSRGAGRADGRIDPAAVRRRIRETVNAATRVRPLWLKRALVSVIAGRISRVVLGRLVDDPVAYSGADPAQLRDQIAESIERLAGRLIVGHVF